MGGAPHRDHRRHGPGRPRFGDVAAEVARALDAAVFVAHNARFDWRFLAANAWRSVPPARRQAALHRRLPAVWCRSCATAGSTTWRRSRGRQPGTPRAFGDAARDARVLRALLERARERRSRPGAAGRAARPAAAQARQSAEWRNAECGVSRGASIGERPLTAIPHSALRIPHSPRMTHPFQSRTSDLPRPRGGTSGSTAAPCSASCRNPCGSAASACR